MINDTGVNMDDICLRILRAMKGFENTIPEVNVILSRINRQDELCIDLGMEELKDRLKIMEDEWGYVKTYTKVGVSGNGVYQAELTERGRQYLREKGLYP
jgi:hypothetical protein